MYGATTWFIMIFGEDIIALPLFRLDGFYVFLENIKDDTNYEKYSNFLG